MSKKLAKMNQGKAIAELEKIGRHEQVCAELRHAKMPFGGHAIPVSGNIVKILVANRDHVGQ